MDGEMKPWNGQVEIGSYKELMPVTVKYDTEEYTIDGITLTAEQAERIAYTYHEYQRYKVDQATLKHAIELTKAMQGADMLKRL